MIAHRKYIQRALSVVVPALLFASTAPAGTLAEWDFAAVSEGTPLSAVPDTVKGVRFEGEDKGVAATGKGTMRVRRPSPGNGTSFAALPEKAGQSELWLTADIAGWSYEGRPGNYVSLGFADTLPPSDVAISEATENEIVLSQMRVARTGREIVRIDGRAWGDGATNAMPGLRVPMTQSEETRIALRYDPRQHAYSVYYRSADKPWRLVKEGATDPTKHPRFVHFNVRHPTNDSQAEGVDIRRMKVATEPPGDLKVPADRPFVTAASWAVSDAATGEFIASRNLDDRRKSASITKAMTTYLIAELGRENPEILEERVLFSAANEKTGGSTSALAAGDSLPVRDCLYAFMLPSGNDMGNALADHFNDRFSPPKGPQPGKPPASRSHFVAEMNRRAKALGMEATEYRSPFGDGGSLDDRTTSARDLLTLARAAMKNPLFRKVVGTKEHTATVTKSDGSTREGVWKNSNFLLGRDGVNGIKTGTTKSAKACLLASATLADGREVYVVVLGSESSHRRYVDTLNILRTLPQTSVDPS